MGTHVRDTHQTAAQIRHDELMVELEYLYEKDSEILAIKNIAKHLWIVLQAVKEIQTKARRL